MLVVNFKVSFQVISLKASELRVEIMAKVLQEFGHLMQLKLVI